MADLYEVVVSGTYLGQRFINRWNYHTASTVGTVTRSRLLAEAFGLKDGNTTLPGIQLPAGSVMERLRFVMHNTAVIDTFQCLNVYDPTDFFSTAISPAVVGGQSGELCPPFIAVKLRSGVVRRDIRPGQKSIAAISENLISGGSLTPGAAAEFQLLASAMSAVLTADDGGTTLSFTPCVVKRQKYQVPDKNTFAYRYYPAAQKEVQMNNLAIGVQWSVVNNVVSQTSRSIGRGI